MDSEGLPSSSTTADPNCVLKWPKIKTSDYWKWTLTVPVTSDSDQQVFWRASLRWKMSSMASCTATQWSWLNCPLFQKTRLKIIRWNSNSEASPGRGRWPGTIQEIKCSAVTAMLPSSLRSHQLPVLYNLWILTFLLLPQRKKPLKFLNPEFITPEAHRTHIVPHTPFGAKLLCQAFFQNMTNTQGQADLSPLPPPVSELFQNPF